MVGSLRRRGLCSVRRLGGTRSGQIGFHRFLHSPAVTVGEMASTARASLAGRVAGKRILAIQDTTDIQADDLRHSLCAHPVIALEAGSGAVLGLAGIEFYARRAQDRGGASHRRKQRAHDEKRSARWLRGLEHGRTLVRAGAEHVLVIADREGDIFEDFAFACDPAHRGLDVLVRAAQDRCLVGGGRLLAAAEALDCSDQLTVDIAAAPGRKARQAIVEYGYSEVEIARPQGRASLGERHALPDQVRLSLIVTREKTPPKGHPPASWILLTSLPVTSIDQARAMVQAYRCRWVIEQLFRTLKSRGMRIETARMDRAALEKLATAAVIAAIQVMQLVQDRDGRGARPLGDVFATDDLPLLQALCNRVQGATRRQRNPHPPDSLAWAAWIIARLGGWDGYYGKPGPITMFNGLRDFRAAQIGWAAKDV